MKSSSLFGSVTVSLLQSPEHGILSILKTFSRYITFKNQIHYQIDCTQPFILKKTKTNLPRVCQSGFAHTKSNKLEIVISIKKDFQQTNRT